jgi:SAM-dependent methyltransferase
MDEWLLRNLVCPIDRTPLTRESDTIWCESRHAYPVVEGLAVLLVPDADPTHPYSSDTLEAAARWRRGEPPGWEEARPDPGGGIDRWVQQEIGNTCGNLYWRLRGRLPRYPIPELRLSPGDGKHLLDIGCNWGRWTIAASRAGYASVGIDPSLRALLAARRVAHQLEVSAQFVVADARHLPFADDCLDVVFSYSVLQHFAREAAEAALEEMGRVVRPSGSCLVQMANRYGVWQLYGQLRQWRRPQGLFAVRRYSPRELLEMFERRIGPAQLEVDGFFTLNAQPADLDLLPGRYRPVVRASEALRKLSATLPTLVNVADSLYVHARPRSQDSSSRTASNRAR